jgi:hypothetical protein
MTTYVFDGRDGSPHVRQIKPECGIAPNLCVQPGHFIVVQSMSWVEESNRHGFSEHRIGRT